jgi:hypothetical protein
MNARFVKKKDRKNHKDGLNINIKAFQCQASQKECILNATVQTCIQNFPENQGKINDF